MNAWLLFSTWLWPVVLAALAPRERFWWTPALGALPALATALVLPVGVRLELPWLLLGTVIGLDATGRVFLLFTSILWLAAGLYAADSFRRGRCAGRFRTLFLLAMAGNLWLIVGQDLVSFYVGFTAMGLAAYGLVIHNGDAEALWAGRVYLIMTVASEVALFLALVLIAHHSGSLTPTAQQLTGLSDLAIGLTVVGLGIKAGIVPLHVWLPLAHPAAPVPASAVLSGAMIKVALLGWMRFLPLGQVALPDWGVLLTVAGITTTLFALPVGLMQTDPKVILAYSSVSKMGLLVMGLGLILMEPALAPAGIAALTLYAAHHGLVKGGLFLGVGLRKQAKAGAWVVVGLAFLALALAGAPLTSGALAKYGVKPLLAEAAWPWLTTAVTLSTIGTTLLMVRFLWVASGMTSQPAPGYRLAGGAWAVLTMLVLAFPFVLGSPAERTTNAGPVAVGLGLALPFALLAWLRPTVLKSLTGLVPPGDILVLGRAVPLVLGRLAGTLWRLGSTVLDGLRHQLTTRLVATHGKPTLEPERWLRASPVAGVLWIGVSGALLLTLVDPDFAWTRPGAQLEQERFVLHPGSVAQLPRAPMAPERTEAPQRSNGGDRQDAADWSADEPSGDRAAPPPTGTQGVADTGVDSPEKKGSARHGIVPRPSATPAPGMAATVSEATSAPARFEDREVPLAAAKGAQQGDDCEPTPYVFRYEGEIGPSSRDALQVSLVRCEVVGDGSHRLVETPVLSNRLVELIQRGLQDLGFDPGRPDGLIGPITRGAIRRFQIDQGVEPDGLITFALLDRIQRALSDPVRKPHTD